jgi:hypothetical protein
MPPLDNVTAADAQGLSAADSLRVPGGNPTVTTAPDLAKIGSNAPCSEIPVYLTRFPDQYAQKLDYLTIPLAGLGKYIQTVSAAHKAELPYFKLAIFGDKRTPHNSLRSNANIVKLTGIEADYDAGKISFEEAVRRLTGACVRALIYTTPSYTEENPRWRIMCPISRVVEGSPEELHKLRSEGLDRLNGIFADGGGFSGESWVLSQSYYHGNIEGKPPIRVEIIDGNYIDLRADLPAVPPRRRTPEEFAARTYEGPAITIAELLTIGQAVADRAQALHGPGDADVVEPDADYHYPNLVLLIMGVARIPVAGDPSEVAAAREEVAHQIRDAVPLSGMDDAKLVSAFNAEPEEGHIRGPGTLVHYARLGGWCPPPVSVEIFADAVAGHLKEHPDYFKAANENTAAEIGELLDLFATIAPEPVLTRDMLPDAPAIEYAFDVAERQGVEPGMSVVAMLTVCASLINDGIKVRRKPGHLERAHFNSTVIADSGVGKSPAMRPMLDPVWQIEAHYRQEYINKKQTYDLQKEAYEKHKKHGSRSRN